MSFVPIFVSTPPPPSRRARELGERIRATIEDYRRSEPDATSNDVRQALHLASPAEGSQRTVALLAGLLGVMVLLAFVFFLRSGLPPDIPWNLVTIGAIAVLGVLFAIVAAARRGAG